MKIKRVLDSKVTQVGGIGVALGIIIGFVACYYQDHGTFLNPECAKQYPLLKNDLDCGEYQDSAKNLQTIDAAVDDAVEQYIKEGKASKISVWTRDLTTLQWASTNEYDRYAPASLLKVPLMIAYYKLAELEPSLLTTELTYQLSPDASTTPEFPPKVTLVPGQKYPVEKLIEQMIVYSDNNAADVLAGNIDQTILNNIFVDLGIEIPSRDGQRTFDFITAKTYSTIFRNLYNASYLNAEYSEKALRLLTKSDFKGIAAGIPEGVSVANKFGERGMNNSDGTQVRELHDCGIVYKPNKPYVVCVMTAGKNEQDLVKIITDLSKIVYAKI